MRQQPFGQERPIGYSMPNCAIQYAPSELTQYSAI
jgi:hypothetical protein